MNTQTMQSTTSDQPTTVELSPSPTTPPILTPATPSPSARVSVEIPSGSGFNPFDPNWIKVWEDVGPIAHLTMLCLLVWLMTRFVEAVKGK
jgi:hypothetical protein